MQNKPETIPPKKRLHMLVQLRATVARAKHTGYVGPEEARILASIGFSVVTGVVDKAKGKISIPDAITKVDNGEVTFDELQAIIYTNTGGYTYAPWGGPLGYTEIYGSQTPAKPFPVEWLFAPVGIMVVLGFVLRALGSFTWLQVGVFSVIGGVFVTLLVFLVLVWIAVRGGK